MKLFFGGAEIKSWRKLFEDEGIRTIGLSYVGLTRRIKDPSKYPLRDILYSGADVFLDSGGYTLNKEDSKYTIDEAHAFAQAYMEFVSSNIDAVSMVSEFDAHILGYDTICEFRSLFYDKLPPEKFMPIWHAEYGLDELDDLCSKYDIVGVTQTEIGDKDLVPMLNGLVSRYGVRLHGVAITGMDIMRQVRWDSVSSMSWLSPSRYGDTILWIDRSKTLKRFPKDYKSSRRQYRTMISDLGFDFDKIEADDPIELLKLSLYSWQCFVANLDSRVTTKAGKETSVFAENYLDSVDTHTPDGGNSQLLPMIPEHRDTQLIPIMGVKFSANNEDDEAEEIPFMFKRSESMRACNTCFLKEKCPGFKPDANCLYNIPIEVKTSEQRRNLQKALIEMQAQRVLFMQMAEDLDGGYADPNLSNEMDRLQRMIKADADSEKEGSYLKVEAYSATSSQGLLDKWFGQGAGSKMSALDAPIAADDLIKESEIYDGELVD